MISEKAYAKVNLSLYITGVRADGYHLLDTVMQRVSLYDTVSVSKNSDNYIKVISDNSSLENENNICFAAAKAFFEKTKISSGVTIEVLKNIPLAAGLGGGSADAAAVLNILNKMYSYPLSYEELCEIGLSLGADVPFCIKGGCARVTGIGENIENIKRKLPLYIVLIKNGEKASTGQMYKAFDKSDTKREENRNLDMVKSLESIDFDIFTETVHNDFSYVWNYDDIKADLEKQGAKKVSLSGSGPTVMGFFENKENADKAAENLTEKYACVFSTTAISE